MGALPHKLGLRLSIYRLEAIIEGANQTGDSANTSLCASVPPELATTAPLLNTLFGTLRRFYPSLYRAHQFATSFDEPP